MKAQRAKNPRKAENSFLFIFRPEGAEIMVLSLCEPKGPHKTQKGRAKTNPPLFSFSGGPEFAKFAAAERDAKCPWKSFISF